MSDATPPASPPATGPETRAEAATTTAATATGATLPLFAPGDPDAALAAATALVHDATRRDLTETPLFARALGPEALDSGPGTTAPTPRRRLADQALEAVDPVAVATFYGALPLGSLGAADYLLHATHDLFIAHDARLVQRIARRVLKRLLGADGVLFLAVEGELARVIDEEGPDEWHDRHFAWRACFGRWSLDSHGPGWLTDPLGYTLPAAGLLLLPVRFGNEVLGGLGAYWYRLPPGPPDVERQTLGQRLARSVALALDALATREHLALAARESQHRLETTRAEMRRLAITDEATELYNRRGFSTLAEPIMARARRQPEHARRLCLLRLTLPLDAGGGPSGAAGDEQTARMAALLRQTFRASDLIGRLGATEFAVLVTDVGQPDDVRRRLDTVLTRHADEHPERARLAPMVGLAVFQPGRHKNLEGFLGDAADALGIGDVSTLVPNA